MCGEVVLFECFLFNSHSHVCLNTVGKYLCLACWKLASTTSFMWIFLTSFFLNRNLSCYLLCLWLKACTKQPFFSVCVCLFLLSQCFLKNIYLFREKKPWPVKFQVQLWDQTKRCRMTKYGHVLSRSWSSSGLVEVVMGRDMLPSRFTAKRKEGILCVFLLAAPHPFVYGMTRWLGSWPGAGCPISRWFAASYEPVLVWFTQLNVEQISCLGHRTPQGNKSRIEWGKS